MSKIHDWISEAAATMGLQLICLSPEESGDIVRQLRRKFADATSELRLWETIDGHVSRKRANGWQDVGEYVADSSCLLIAEEDDSEVYCISNGKDLQNLLSECPGFEFYVTNYNLDYLLCHNHHDYLIGTGASAEWVATKPDD